MQDLESSFLLPKPAFHFGSSVRAHAWPLFVGLALFASGLSIAEQRRRLFSLAARTRATTRFVPLVTTGIMRVTFTDGSTWSGEELVDRIDNSRADKKEGCRIRTGRQNSD
jgi:hypothetical protein